MNERKELIEFEVALDELILSELTHVTQEQVNEHFGGVTLQEHIKLVLWSSEMKG